MRVAIHVLAPVLLVVCPAVAHCQRVTITALGRVETQDAKVFRTDTIGGGGSEHVVLKIVNSSRGDVKYEIHSHSKLDFIRFHDKSNNEDAHRKLPISETLKAGKQDAWEYYVQMKQGSPGIVQDTLHVRIWDAENKELPTQAIKVVAVFRGKGTPPVLTPPPTPGQPGLPEGYEIWTLKGKKLRMDVEYLPIRIYSDDPDFEVIVERSVTIWNSVGKRAGVKKPFFEQVPKSDADFEVNWKDRINNGKAVGLAVLAPTKGPDWYLDRVDMMRYKAKMTDELRATLAETLLQELGHMMGLDHSQVKDDIMYGKVHAHKHQDLSFVAVSERDYQALSWLYAQEFNDRLARILPKRARLPASE